MALGSLMIVSAVVPCNARALQAPEGSIRLNTISGIPVVDGVFLDGHGPYRFLLDTGAQMNQVEASLASKIGLAQTLRTEMATVTGIIPVAGGRVAEVSLGSAKASDQEFLYTTLDGAHRLSTNIQGVLGQAFLAHFDYLLDFADHFLVFGATAPEGGTRIGFETIDGCPVIETSEGNLVLDSGANVTVLYRARVPVSDGPTIRTASGAAAVARIENLRLGIAGRHYHPASAVSIPRALLKGDGLLPVSLFRAIFISNSSKYVVLDPGVDSSETRPR